MRARVALAAAVLALVSITGADAASNSSSDCPLQFTDTKARPGGLLLGGVLATGACLDGKGKPCPRSGYWSEECKMPTMSQSFATCDEEQRAAGLLLAEKLRGGEALRASPCDLYPYIRGRTLWLIG